MALLPLRNALSFLDSAPTAMNFRVNPSTNSPVWNETSQYFLNDCVISSVTGGMFIFAGNATNQTTIRGGTEPWEDSFSATPSWVSVSSAGLTDVFSGPIAVTAPTTAANTAVVATLGTFSLPEELATPGATYLVSWQGQWATTAGDFIATDRYTWSFTPNGAGAVGVSATVSPGAVPSPYNMAGSAVVIIPSLGNQITGALTSGAAALNSAPLFTNLRVSYSRIQ